MIQKCVLRNFHFMRVGTCFKNPRMGWKPELFPVCSSGPLWDVVVVWSVPKSPTNSANWPRFLGGRTNSNTFCRPSGVSDPVFCSAVRSYTSASSSGRGCKKLLVWGWLHLIIICRSKVDWDYSLPIIVVGRRCEQPGGLLASDRPPVEWEVSHRQQLPRPRQHRELDPDSGQTH